MLLWNRDSISNGFWDIKAQMYRGQDLDLWGYVTSSVTWLFDSQYVISYRCSIDIDTLSWTVFEILSLKYIRVTTLTFQGHVTSSITWPFNSQCVISYRSSIVTNPLSWAIFEILSLNCIRVATLIFRVTWRHRSRDQSIRYILFPIGCLLYTSDAADE